MTRVTPPNMCAVWLQKVSWNSSKLLILPLRWICLSMHITSGHDSFRLQDLGIQTAVSSLRMVIWFIAMSWWVRIRPPDLCSSIAIIHSVEEREERRKRTYLVGLWFFRGRWMMRIWTQPLCKPPGLVVWRWSKLFCIQRTLLVKLWVVDGIKNRFSTDPLRKNSNSDVLEKMLREWIREDKREKKWFSAWWRDQLERNPLDVSKCLLFLGEVFDFHTTSYPVAFDTRSFIMG